MPPAPRAAAGRPAPRVTAVCHAAGWESVTEDDNPLFCVPCGKLFAKETTMLFHINSKKHKMALRRYAGPRPSI